MDTSSATAAVAAADTSLTSLFTGAAKTAAPATTERGLAALPPLAAAVATSIVAAPAAAVAVAAPVAAVAVAAPVAAAGGITEGKETVGERAIGIKCNKGGTGLET